MWVFQYNLHVRQPEGIQNHHNIIWAWLHFREWSDGLYLIVERPMI